MTTVQELISHYNLLPHPEGGWYKETYRSEGAVAANALSASFSGDRAFSTAIYFLLERGNFSAFHRIKSDECWHFYTGGALEIFVIQPDGKLVITRLGSDTSRGEIFQYVVPAHCWFASRPAAETAFSLVGCTVSPGFDFADFELANADSLIKTHPQHEVLIRELCR